MNEWPIEDLERRAVEERRALHNRATELKSKVLVVRESIDINRTARRHFGVAAVVLAVTGLLFGYAFAGLFSDR